MRTTRRTFAFKPAFLARGRWPNSRRARLTVSFKQLVPRHHPDANAGDRSSKDPPIYAILSYNPLKSAGLG